MTKLLQIGKIAFLAIIMLSLGSVYAQKKGKVHIKISGDDTKIDTVIIDRINISFYTSYSRDLDSVFKVLFPAIQYANPLEGR